MGPSLCANFGGGMAIAQSPAMLKASISIVALAGLTWIGCGGSALPADQGGGAGQPGITGGAGGTHPVVDYAGCFIDTVSPSGAKIASIHVSASTNTGAIDVVIYD